MKLIDKFVDNFPSSENKIYLKQCIHRSTPPCLFYGKFIDCQNKDYPYEVRRCYQNRYMPCWEQEEQAHLPQAITRKMLEKFNKFY